jgi:hypothetical protein
MPTKVKAFALSYMRVFFKVATFGFFEKNLEFVDLEVGRKIVTFN